MGDRTDEIAERIANARRIADEIMEDRDGDLNISDALILLIDSVESLRARVEAAEAERDAALEFKHAVAAEYDAWEEHDLEGPEKFAGRVELILTAHEVENALAARDARIRRAALEEVDALLPEWAGFIDLELCGESEEALDAIRKLILRARAAEEGEKQE